MRLSTVLNVYIAVLLIAGAAMVSIGSITIGSIGGAALIALGAAGVTAALVLFGLRWLELKS